VWLSPSVRSKRERPVTAVTIACERHRSGRDRDVHVLDEPDEPSDGVRARIVALEDRLVGAHDRLQSGLPAGPLQRAEPERRVLPDGAADTEAHAILACTSGRTGPIPRRGTGGRAR